MLKIIQNLKQKFEVQVLLDIAADLRAKNKKLVEDNLNLMHENTELKEKVSKLEMDNDMLRVYVDERFTPDLYAYGAEKKEGE